MFADVESRPADDQAAPENLPRREVKSTARVTGAKAPLHPTHRGMLERSGISEAVMDARGYRSLNRGSPTDTEQCKATLKRLGFASTAFKEDTRFPGLLIPLHSPKGGVVSYQYRPDHPRRDDKGKLRKYEAVKGRASALDINPLLAAHATDPTVPLLVTEGVKKGDAITSAALAVGTALCPVAISGVYNWRSTHGTLGEWEDIFLRGRTVYVVFDSDTSVNRNVARAMARLGAWLKSRGAKPQFVVTPGKPEAKWGADDFLAAGGTLAELLAAATGKAPNPDDGDDSLTEARLAETIADNALADRYRYCGGLGGWMGWDGAVWSLVEEETVIEVVRQHFRQMLTVAVEDKAGSERLKALAGLQSRGRISAVTALARGVDGVHTPVGEWNSDPWLLNCPNGVVDLRDGTLAEHEPSTLITKVSGAEYKPGFTHPDWDAARGAFADAETEDWCQQYLGTGVTGKMPEADIVTFWHGGGSNGKTTIMGAVQKALGEYGRTLMHGLLGSKNEDHPTEYMDLFGLRLGVIEELPDGHRLDVAKIKRIVGTEVITARKMRQDPVSFDATHTLVITGCVKLPGVVRPWLWWIGRRGG